MSTHTDTDKGSRAKDDELPARVAAWIMVARTSDLNPGRVIAAEALGVPLALFRTRDGVPHALAAHCAHMGAHLANGTVVNDRLRCPLHHWEFAGDGFCEEKCVGQTVYPVAESFGCVFVFNAETATFPPPAFAEAQERELVFRVGRSTGIDCPWQAVAANGFDMQHFSTVHGRALREPPVVEAVGHHALRLRYRSRVTGTSLADRVMKRIARDDIRATVTSWGGVSVLVETDAGGRRSFLLLNFTATPGGTRVTPIYAILREGSAARAALRLAVTALLFDAFIRRDVAIMRGMRFRPRLAPGEDPVLARYLDFLRGLAPSGEPENCA